jgi:hypothetical protein
MKILPARRADSFDTNQTIVLQHGQLAYLNLAIKQKCHAQAIATRMRKAYA